MKGLDRAMFLKLTYRWEKALDIAASRINSTYDVNKDQNGIIKTPLFHTPTSYSSRNGHDHGLYCREKNGNDELVPRFWRHFFTHLLPDILTKHNIKETASKGNIWGPFYIPKGEILDGG